MTTDVSILIALAAEPLYSVPIANFRPVPRVNAYSFETLAVPPSEMVVPLIVIELFTSLLLTIPPANMVLVTVLVSVV